MLRGPEACWNLHVFISSSAGKGRETQRGFPTIWEAETRLDPFHCSKLGLFFFDVKIFNILYRFFVCLFLILIAFGQFRCLSYFFFFQVCWTAAVDPLQHSSAGLLLANHICSAMDYYFKALGEVSVAVHLHIALPLTRLIPKCQKSWGAFF